ncbi:hypothetical protein B0A55_10416 [Friedmanniomyces simplex]|uniref:Uncharacterized protein n=1 Tax=Friedmanniomyces simplex TaxID=329884 RepID=A0A4U0WM19_9PEZI|nr:hypothetical protein B0A55_10416 [Friedmanniomyces simplex]
MSRKRPAPDTVMIDEESVDAIHEPIVEAINQACDKMLRRLTKLDETLNKPQQPALNLREQILANARILWPILEGKRKCADGKPNSSPRATPQMEVVVHGAGDAVQAAVLRSGMADYCPEVEGIKKYIFVRSENEDSPEMAIQKLLDLTMVMLRSEVINGGFYKAKGDKSEVVKGAKKCDRLSPTPRNTPEMEVIVVGKGTTIYAAVLRNDLREDESQDNQFFFMRSTETDTAEKAMQSLLETTMILLNREASRKFYCEEYDQKISALVVRTEYDDSEQPVYNQNRCVLPQPGDAETVEKALQKLLERSMAMLDEVLSG